jgi:hypothetical protein
MTEIPRHVIRICRLLELRRMTLVTIRVMQLIVAVHVARLATRRSVCARQWEQRGAVIER